MARVSAGTGGEAHLRLRAQLMEAVRDVIRARELRQREAAVLFGVAQPRISDLVRGKLALFSIDTLVSMLAAAGVSVEIKLRSPEGRSGARSTSRRQTGRSARERSGLRHGRTPSARHERD